MDFVITTYSYPLLLPPLPHCTGRLADYQTDIMTDQKTGRLTDWQTDRLKDFQTGKPRDWQTGRLTD